LKATIDTNVLIYFLEESPKFYPECHRLFSLIRQGDLSCFLSVLTISEICVKPVSLGDEKLATEYYNLLTSAKNVSVVPVTPEISYRAALIRGIRPVTLLDALHIATASSTASTFFVTFDDDLLKLDKVEDVKLISPSELLESFKT